MSENGRKLVSLVTGVLLLISMFLVGRETARTVSGTQVKFESKLSNIELMSAKADKGCKNGKSPGCVVIDAGHGGDDPGKVGVNGALEKDINLEIAELVKSYLEAEDIEVILTRDSADGLYDADASNKKVQDMKRRIAIIEESAPLLTVSIHQNSYPEEYVHGAQVFYYEGSMQGKELAESIQRQMVKKLDPENKRQVKANNSYYLLKKTSTPIVIVECGFLSNRFEAEQLCDERYREDVAWAIHMGIMQYLNK